MDKLLSQNEWIILNGLLLVFGVVWMFRAARTKDKMEYYRNKALHFEQDNIGCIREVKAISKRLQWEQNERKILEKEILKMDPGFEFTMST